MKENLLKKIYNHPEQQEIISKLVLEISPKEINKWLSEKYIDIDKNLIISAKSLQQFKDEYLDIYTAIQRDAVQLQQEVSQNVSTEVAVVIKNNSAYRRKLEEYLDKEIDIKQMITNLIVAIEFRASQVFDAIQENPNASKLDYILINYMNSLANMLDKYNSIILNAGSNNIIQQNNINIQILDQHIGVFHKVIREVISKLDYETSLLFVDTLNEELKKLKAPTVDQPDHIDIRLSEAKQLEDKLNQLDIPSA